MFSFGEPSRAAPGSRRRGGPVPLLALWLGLRDDLLEACKRAEAVQKVPGAELESPLKSFTDAA